MKLFVCWLDQRIVRKVITLRKKNEAFPGQITLEEYEKVVHNEMAVKNMEWAKGLVRFYVYDAGEGVAYEKEELEGVALYGLALAIRTFDSNRVSFRTYASKVIKNELMDHLNSYSKKSLKTVGLETIENLPAKEEDESYDTLLDLMIENCKDRSMRLGLYAIKERNKGITAKELEKRTGIPQGRWYYYTYMAREKLKESLRKNTTIE